MVRPTVMLGPGELVVSATTPAARAALAEGRTGQPAESFAPLLNKLPAEMIYMSLSDPRASTSVFVRMLAHANLVRQDQRRARHARRQGRARSPAT